MKHFMLSCLHYHVNFIINSMILCNSSYFDILVAIITSFFQFHYPFSSLFDSGFLLCVLNQYFFLTYEIPLSDSNVYSLTELIVFLMMIILMIMKMVEANFYFNCGSYVILVHAIEKLNLGRNFSFMARYSILHSHIMCTLYRGCVCSYIRQDIVNILHSVPARWSKMSSRRIP